MLSEHFDDSEFRCRCCQSIGDGIATELIELLERIRTHLGDRPISIISGYRCTRHNIAVGGARSSQHLLGNAADIRVQGLDPRSIYDEINHMVAGGLGLYESFVHVDVRRNTARWLG